MTRTSGLSRRDDPAAGDSGSRGAPPPALVIEMVTAMAPPVFFLGDWLKLKKERRRTDVAVSSN
jgi:hypothetical protein